ncbi:MAG: glucose 1-dehydrogenase [bacterium]|nr:glucose 1-dehydrogenase [bacterium]
MGKLEGRVAVVTGGGSGLGRGMCLRFAKEGAKVIVADLKPEAAEETVRLIKEEQGEALAVECNVLISESIQEMVKKGVEAFGKIDILSNNTGICLEARTSTRICDLKEEDWDFTMNLNLKSTYLCCKYVIPEMIKAGGGNILNISSIAGHKPAFSAAYGAAKAGVIALTQSVAMQYADDNIRVNCICPGPMKTPTGIMANKLGIYKQAQPARIRMLERLGEAEDIANAAVFLLSDDSSFITGTRLDVDGGSIAMTVNIPPRVKPESDQDK